MCLSRLIGRNCLMCWVCGLVLVVWFFSLLLSLMVV